MHKSIMHTLPISIHPLSLVSETVLTILLGLTFVPTALAVTDIPVENDFAAFTLPKNWKVIESRSKDLPKPLVYFRQKYKVTVVAGPTGSAYIYAQDLPAFRGAEMSLADIDAAFERISQLSSDTSSLADNYIPSIMEMKTSTGTFLGKPSREIEFWTERNNTIVTVRMSHVSLGGKLYAIEFYTTKKIEDANVDWRTLHDSMYVHSSSATSSSAKSTSPTSVHSIKSQPTKSSASSSSSSTKVDKSPRGAKAKVKIRRRSRQLNAQHVPAPSAGVY